MNYKEQNNRVKQIIMNLAIDAGYGHPSYTNFDEIDYKFWEDCHQKDSVIILAQMLDKARKEKWISVDDKPKESGRYWCYVAEINDLGLSHYQWNCAYNKEDNQWSSNAMVKTVTHWMPLPEPPKS